MIVVNAIPFPSTPQAKITIRSQAKLTESHFLCKANIIDIAATINEIEALSIEDRIHLVQAIWDGIAEDRACADLTDMQKQELDRRIADSDNNPENVMTRQQI